MNESIDNVFKEKPDFNNDRYFAFFRYSYPDWNRVGSTAKQPCFKDAIVHSYRPVGVVGTGGTIAPPLNMADRLTLYQPGRAYYTQPHYYQLTLPPTPTRILRPSYGPDQELLCLLEGCFDRIWETSLSNQLSRSSVFVPQQYLQSQLLYLSFFPHTVTCYTNI